MFAYFADGAIGGTGGETGNLASFYYSPGDKLNDLMVRQ